MRKLLVTMCALIVAIRACNCREETTPLRIATFNIEDFPKTDKQIDGAFAEIAATGASIVAVQEITDPQFFAAIARERLGANWRFEYVDPGNAPHHIGLLFDTTKHRFITKRVHDELRLEDQRQKPALDVELDNKLRILVVHLKAGGENHPIRRRQLAALGKIVTSIEATGARVIVLGDFNATGDADRTDIARLANESGVTWTTEGLACSAFWDRDDGCPRSRLDHVLSTETARDVRATGACATDGCARQDTCPLYAEEVSDHCPVVVDFP
jgi:endonuclease/exonuclease/phosphatase family metal-dependent hydrolase